jgi:hypothetical protein
MVAKGIHAMSDRFLNAHDEAQSLLMEAIWEKYASAEQVADFCHELKVIKVLRANEGTEWTASK